MSHSILADLSLSVGELAHWWTAELHPPNQLARSPLGRQIERRDKNTPRPAQLAVPVRSGPPDSHMHLICIQSRAVASESPSGATHNDNDGAEASRRWSRTD